MEVRDLRHATAAVSPGKKTRYPLCRRLGGPKGRSGRVRKISLPPGLDARTVRPVASSYTDWAIPARINSSHVFQIPSALPWKVLQDFFSFHMPPRAKWRCDASNFQRAYLLLSLPALLSTNGCLPTASNLVRFKVRGDTMVRHGGPDWRWDLTRSINHGGCNSSAPRAPVPGSDLGIESRTWTLSPRAFR